MNYVNLNGKLMAASDAAVPVDNGGFRYGYGIFETMLVQDGVIALKERHWDRLFGGAAVLEFDVPATMTRQWLEEQVMRTVKKNELEHLCRVRLQLFAGSGGLYDRKNNTPGVVINCFSLEPETMSMNENGLVVGIADGLEKSVNKLANLKSCNCLINGLAALQAKSNKWNDILIRNNAGNIIESAIANIFWIKDGTIFTPPLSDGCVAGVTRQYIMEKTPVTERSLNEEELLRADEVFLTNAIKRIRWVGRLGERAYNNEQTRQLFAHLFGGQFKITI